MVRSVIATALVSALSLAGATRVAAQATTRAVDRPNVLWLTIEDVGQQLGCYGDTYATTPNLDRFAARSIRYHNAWSNAPVCAPARTTIITGLYVNSTGAEHMRSDTTLPPGIRMFPQLLRDAGYYTTNNVKEDYNVNKPGQVWDDSSNTAHWRNRPAGKPFFAVFNHTGTHESQARKRPHTLVHDPANAPLPAYYPDTPEVRQNVAQYYDNLTRMDNWFARQMAALEEAGLADDTIVFFYGDHGAGLPRSKRSPVNSGLRVPLIVHVPEKWRHLAPPGYAPGAASDRLVSFVDLAPTMWAIADVAAPEWAQGSAFMGRSPGDAPKYNYAVRGRMDERSDSARSLTDGRYVYVRNFLPHLPAGQPGAYMMQMPIARVWKAMFDAGKLTPAQRIFWEPKATEELFDYETDKDEVKNLAGSPEHRETLLRLRAEMHRWMLERRDIGLLPEAEMQARAKNSSPWAVGHDPAFPLERLLETAELASDRALDPSGDELAKRFADAENGVRYWAAIGMTVRGRGVASAHRAGLKRLATSDASPSVRIAAAEALTTTGDAADFDAAMAVLLDHADADRHGAYVASAALEAIDRQGTRAAAFKDRLAKLPPAPDDSSPAVSGNVSRLLDHVDETLGITRAETATRRRGSRRGAGNVPAGEE